MIALNERALDVLAGLGEDRWRVGEGLRKLAKLRNGNERGCDCERMDEERRSLTSSISTAFRVSQWAPSLTTQLHPKTAFS